MKDKTKYQKERAQLFREQRAEVQRGSRHVEEPRKIPFGGDTRQDRRAYQRLLRKTTPSEAKRRAYERSKAQLFFRYNVKGCRVVAETLAERKARRIAERGLMLLMATAHHD